MKIFGPKLGGYTLQDSGNLFMDNIIYFHNLVLCILFFILFLVTWFLIKTLLYFGFPNEYKNLINKIYYLIYEVDFAMYKYCLHRNFFYDCMDESIIADGYLDPQDILFASCDPFRRYEAHQKALQNSEYLKLSTREYFNSNFMPYFFINLFSTYKVESLKEFLKENNIEYRYYFYSDIKLEFIWTIFPSLILFFLAFPSFGILFSVEKVSSPELTVKVIGHQWYWEYQYMDYINFMEIVENETYKYIYMNKLEDNYIIESYMISDEDLLPGQFRLLEVDKKLILPINTSIRLLITSDDVLHSWAVPSLGIKVDACPGRINELIIKIRDIGLFYGQCSELCGWYHGFMPIVIQSLKVEDFKYWAVSSFLDVKYIKKD